jgi:HlyD family secretion protein
MKGNIWNSVWLFLATFLLLQGCRKAGPAYYQGYVEGEYVFVATSASGNLEKLEVNKGQTVAAGAPLFQLDPNPQALQIEEATQRIEQARARLQDLSTGGRPSELAAIEARLKTARATLV